MQKLEEGLGDTITKVNRVEIDMAAFATQVEESKEKFADMVQVELANRQGDLERVVLDARKEFDAVKLEDKNIKDIV